MSERSRDGKYFERWIAILKKIKIPLVKDQKEIGIRKATSGSRELQAGRSAWRRCHLSLQARVPLSLRLTQSMFLICGGVAFGAVFSVNDSRSYCKVLYFTMT